ncbi:MAG: aminopeptidase P family protein [Pseudomonadota bacterium]
MRQSFDVRGGPQDGRANLPKLRAAMADQGLDVFYVPHDDEYQNEYLPAANERLAWATGFTGSAGAAMILAETAAVFVDGRYTVQARDQLDADLFETVGLPVPGPFNWLADLTLSGKTVGYDPRLMSPNALSDLRKCAEKSGAKLVPTLDNPIDLAWADRPGQPRAPIVAHPLDKAGKAHADKRSDIAGALKSDGADATVLTSPASIAWAFNIRGGDVACSPLPLARAILRADGSAALFTDLDKIDEALRTHLGNGVTLDGMEALPGALSDLSGKTVSLDPDLASAWFFETLEGAGATILRQRDPVALPRACKNSAEIAGSMAAHVRDGAAVTRFLHWLDTEAQSGAVTEIDAAIQLERFRDTIDGLQDLSFETISGAGPNGALPHYRVSSATNRPLERGTLYLVDSGGQYLDGTTDITRTVAIGEPSAAMRRHYTLVLKGHIALADVRFPEGTTGTHLDILARHALWQAGLDYDHGTGHGVGVYLGVHEGPQRIAKAWNSVALMPGMIVSNEPGYYREGAYGIRIENLQYVTEKTEIPGGDRPMLGFENLTWAPLARALIDLELVSDAEHAWIDAYHSEVKARIAPQVEGEVAAWLDAACAPLSGGGVKPLRS